MTLTMPTREFVGLLADVLPFATTDDEDTAWYRVTVEWDGSRLHAAAGSALRCAHMSWGPDDADDDNDDDRLFDIARDGGDDEPWRVALLPDDVKDLIAKFKLSVKEGTAPLDVTGTYDGLRVVRNGEGRVALTSFAESRPWDEGHPDIRSTINTVRTATTGHTRAAITYSGPLLSDFVNPKVVRQRGPVVLAFGPKSSYVRVGFHFEGCVLQDLSGPN